MDQDEEERPQTHAASPLHLVVNYIGFHDKGMLLAGGCGNTNGEPKIERTGYLQKAFEFGKQIYPEELNTDQ